jgi:glycerol-3-phosphate dehydrogenase
MAQDTVDVLSKRDGQNSPPHPTQNLPLAGSAGWPAVQGELETKGVALGLSTETIAHLDQSYGSLARDLLALVEHQPELGQRLVDDLPYISAEVVYACRYEMAVTVSDVLSRRTSIILEDYERGVGILTRVATLMAQELGWSPEQQAAMIEAYREEVHEQQPTT